MIPTEISKLVDETLFFELREWVLNEANISLASCGDCHYINDLIAKMCFNSFSEEKYELDVIPFLRDIESRRDNGFDWEASWHRPDTKINFRTYMSFIIEYISDALNQALKLMERHYPDVIKMITPEIIANPQIIQSPKDWFNEYLTSYLIKEK